MTLLREAVKRTGGVERWSREMNVPPGTLRRGSRRAWDDERLDKTVGPLVASLGRWPAKGEFERAGLASALVAMYRHGGISFWRHHFGVQREHGDTSSTSRRRWTEERIESDLCKFCAERGGWPSWQEFRASGRASLYRAASMYGGIARWRERVDTTDR